MDESCSQLELLPHGALRAWPKPCCSPMIRLPGSAGWHKGPHSSRLQAHVCMALRAGPSQLLSAEHVAARRQAASETSAAVEAAEQLHAHLTSCQPRLGAL